MSILKSMPTLDESITALELFNEKAQKLMNSSFVQALQSPDAVVKISGKRLEDGQFSVMSERGGPKGESIDAFILNFRFFIQNNEASSLKNVAAVYHAGDFENDLAGRFDSARNAINELLDKPNLMNLGFDDIVPNNRRVMEVFIYGSLAHGNDKEKAAAFKEWMAFPPMAIMSEACFHLILGNILNGIAFIARLNLEALAQLSDRRSGSKGA
jgi:hypothetical protein